MHVVSQAKFSSFIWLKNAGYLYMKTFILHNRHQDSDKPNPVLTIQCHTLYNIKKKKK